MLRLADGAASDVPARSARTTDRCILIRCVKLEFRKAGSAEAVAAHPGFIYHAVSTCHGVFRNARLSTVCCARPSSPVGVPFVVVLCTL